MTASTLPLTGFERFRTRDVDEARHRAGRLLSSHSIQPAAGGSRLDVHYHSVDLLDCSVLYAQYGAAVRLDPGALEDFYLVGVPLAGTSLVSCGGHELVTHPGLASVQSCRQRVSTEWHEGCRKLSVKIDRQALERCLGRMLGRLTRRPVVFEVALDLERGCGASWRRLMEHLVAELSPVSSYLRSAPARRALSDTIISTLLVTQRHNYSDQLQAEPQAPAPRHVRRVEEIVHADPSLSHRPIELAAQVGVSLRSLQAGFQRYRGMTLTAFVQQRRLALAHEALRSAPAGASVTVIALEAGYTHMGRFARDYKAAFGESPSRTLQRGPVDC